MSEAFPASSVVVTNLRHVMIRGVHLDCRALVLANNPDLNEGKERRYRIDGYGACCTWHVFDLPLRSAEYSWEPSTTELLAPARRGILTVETKETGPVGIGLEVQNFDLPISFQTIEGTWTPGSNDDWATYNQSVAARVFDQSCAVVEKLGFPLNIQIPIASRPDIARELFEKDGVKLRLPLRVP